MAKTKDGLRLHMPAAYRIRVQGYLDQSWSDRLGGLTIKVSNPGDEAPVTTLSGRLLDQTALFGVLNTLYDLRLSLLSVVCVGYDPIR